eukprot:6194619-Pleurochrysis_carterae.AAC.3
MAACLLLNLTVSHLCSPSYWTLRRPSSPQQSSTAIILTAHALAHARRRAHTWIARAHARARTCTHALSGIVAHKTRAH